MKRERKRASAENFSVTNGAHVLVCIRRTCANVFAAGCKRCRWGTETTTETATATKSFFVSALCCESWDARDETWAVHQLRAYCLSARMSVGQQGFFCLSLFRSHCLACTLAGLMKYLLTALFDQLATGLLMSRALHQASGGGLRGGAAPPWTLWKYLLSKLHFTCVCMCVCVRAVFIFYLCLRTEINSKWNRSSRIWKILLCFFPSCKINF